MKCENALQPLPANAASLPLHCYNVHKEISNQAASKYIDPAGCAHSGQLSCALDFCWGPPAWDTKQRTYSSCFSLNCNREIAQSIGKNSNQQSQASKITY